MDNQDALKAVAKADAIAEILEHVGWEDYLKPAFDKLRESAVQQLVRSTLGLPSQSKQTPLQAAGVVYGIDFVQTYLEISLVKGDRAHYEINKAIAEFDGKI